VFKYRRANIRDVDSIIKVMRNTTYAQYVYPGKSLSELKNIISKTMSDRIFLVCFDGTRKIIVGYFIIDSFNNHLSDIPKKVRLNRKYAYHAGVGIHSDYRGKGLATKLTQYAFKIANSKGYLGMYADVGSNNDASIRLQEKCGFREIARYVSKWRPKGVKNVVFEIKFG
jgi:ribosomal protein S18 acetylase RimI-like enzyme